MNRETLDIATVTILDKEYRLTCPEEERDALSHAARLLDERMRKIRTGGRVVGLDRVAILAALNLAHELLQSNTANGTYVRAVHAQIQHMQDKIDAALLDESQRRE